MITGYDEVIGLISKWEDFKTHENGNLNGFANWVLTEKKSNDSRSDYEGFIASQTEEMEEKNSIPDLANMGVIRHLMSRLNLFVKHYAKQPFHDLGLNSLEEFRLLQMIGKSENINKSQLSNESLMEFSTVVDILKRFIKKGLIIQVPDPNDQRASLLKITDEGKDLLSKTYKIVAALKPNIAGDLSKKEQEILISLLNKLNIYHTDFFEEHYDSKKKKV